jgi:hypothetical protein
MTYRDAERDVYGQLLQLPGNLLQEPLELRFLLLLRLWADVILGTVCVFVWVGVSRKELRVVVLGGAVVLELGDGGSGGRHCGSRS